MPDDFEDLLKKALEEIEKRAQEREGREERERERLLEEQKEAIERFLQSERENTYFDFGLETMEAYEEEGFRGLFFSLEDALEYAKDIPESIPVVIVETPDGYAVVVMY
jgi:alkanesulfonate monooxygenase SsuD/methylene tetrahydromethanopterin reductase-like flavin-dependent oxidoreductase (luciferase family)